METCTGGEYRREKKEYKELCDRKKREENERWEREAEEARTEGQIWAIVNRERKKWKGINREIEMEKWEEYFRELLGEIRKGCYGNQEQGEGMRKEN